MRALVFGSSGCLGTALVNQLIAKGYQVTCAGRTKKRTDCNFVFCDLNFPETVLELKIASYDTVFYAPQSSRYTFFPDDLVSTFNINSFSPTLLAKITSRIGISFNYVSTGSVYAESEVACTEDAPLVSQESATMYTTSKILGEREIQMMEGDIRIFRPFFIFGPKARPQTLIPKIQKSVMEGDVVYLHGHNGMRINPISSIDAARAILFMSQQREKVVNIAGPEVFDLRTIANLIGKKLNMQPNFQILEDHRNKSILGSIKTLESNKFSFSDRFSDCITKGWS